MSDNQSAGHRRVGDVSGSVGSMESKRHYVPSGPSSKWSASSAQKPSLVSCGLDPSV